MHMNISSDVMRGYNDTIILYFLLEAGAGTETVLAAMVCAPG